MQIPADWDDMGLEYVIVGVHGGIPVDWDAVGLEYVGVHGGHDVVQQVGLVLKQLTKLQGFIFWQ